MADDLTGKVRTYTSDDVDVQYSLKRCIHAAECVKRLGSVFDTAKKPWIQPAEASADDVAATIPHCPTGALHYTRKDGGADEATPTENTMHIEADGPIYLRGDATIVNSAGDAILHDTRMALCRCGASKNKPLCDLSHLAAGFKAADDLAANMEQSGKLLEGSDGVKIHISPAQDGPLHVTGNFKLYSSDGDTIFEGGDAWLCRCGGSSNKPFCDGTHNKIDFKADA